MYIGNQFITFDKKLIKPELEEKIRKAIKKTSAKNEIFEKDKEFNDIVKRTFKNHLIYNNDIITKKLILENGIAKEGAVGDLKKEKYYIIKEDIFLKKNYFDILQLLDIDNFKIGKFLNNKVLFKKNVFLVILFN